MADAAKHAHPEHIRATATIFALTPMGPITSAIITVDAADQATAEKILEKVLRNVTAHTMGEPEDENTP